MSEKQDNQTHLGGLPSNSGEPPVISAWPPLAGAPPPPLLPKPDHKPWPVRPLVAFLLSLCLGLFLADAIVSLADESLILLFGIHLLATIRGLAYLFTMLFALLIYVLMGLTPMIPKRLFLPITLFNPIAGLVTVLFSIYFYAQRSKRGS